MSNTLDLVDQLLPRVKQDQQEIQHLHEQVRQLVALLGERDEALEDALDNQKRQQEQIAGLRLLLRRRDNQIRELSENQQQMEQRLRESETEREKATKVRDRAEADKLLAEEQTAATIREIEEAADARVDEANRHAAEAAEDNEALIQRIEQLKGTAGRLKRRGRRMQKERDEAIERACRAEDNLQVERATSENLRALLENRRAE
jgi:hypothetical protein